MKYTLLVNTLSTVEPTTFQRMPFDSFWADSQLVFQRHLDPKHVKAVKGEYLPLYSKEACDYWQDISTGKIK